MLYPTTRDENDLAEHAQWTVQNTDPVLLFQAIEPSDGGDTLTDIEADVINEARAGWYNPAVDGDWLAAVVRAEVDGQVNRRLLAAVHLLAC